MRKRSFYGKALAAVVAVSFILTGDTAFVTSVSAEPLTMEEGALQEEAVPDTTGINPDEIREDGGEDITVLPNEDLYEDGEEGPISDEEEYVSDEEGYVSDEESDIADEDMTEEPVGYFDAAADGNETIPDSDDETDSEEEFADGYIEMPWDNDTPVADGYEDYSEAKEDIVKVEMPARDRYVSEPETIQSRYPDYDTEAGILSYLKEKYPSTRNQNPYGSCWAHSAVALSEFYMINHNIRDREGGYPDTGIDFSELQLAYFCYNQAPYQAAGDSGDKVRYEGKTKNFLQYGGNLGFAAQSLMRYNGVTADSGDAAYSNAENVIAEGLADGYAFSKDLAHLKNDYQINIKKNPKLVKQAILENGIAGVSIYAGDSYFNSSTNAFYNNEKTSTNHAVAVVGWDDDYPVTKFRSDRRPSGKGAWLIRNSWSTNTKFSYFSYFWLSYEDKSLAETAYVYEMATPEEYYDNNYNYDSQLHNVSPAPGYKTANIFFTAGSDDVSREILKAVQLDVTNSGNTGAVDYEISVYKNLTDSNDPESGTKVTEATTRGTLPFRGNYTIPLNTAVELNRDEAFSVIVTTQNGKIDREYDLNWTDKENNVVVMDIDINYGESFYCNTSKWYDMADNHLSAGNLCIRALTDDETKSLPEKEMFTVTTKNSTYNGDIHEAVVTSSEDEINTAGITVLYGRLQNGKTEAYSKTAPKNAGTYMVKIKTPRTANYIEAEFEDEAWTFTISKADIGASDITKVPAARTLVYNGASQQLVSPGTVKSGCGSMQYALGTGRTTAPSGGYKASVPYATAAGQYYVWYRIKGDANHNDTAPKCLTVSIGKNSRPLSVVLDKTAYKYDGKVKTPSVAVKCDGRTLKVNTDYKVTLPARRTNAATYKVVVAGKGNYSGTGTATFKINKAENTLKVTGKTADVKYSKLSGKAQTLSVSKVLAVKNAKGKVTYKKKEGSSKIKIDKNTGKVTVSKGLKKKTYSVKIAVTAAGDGNHKGATKTVTVKIRVR